jgi:dihydroorotate dehydrogenase electron transfer subunit
MTGPWSGTPRPARIVEKISENAKTVSFVLDTPMKARPGQFAMLWLPGLDEKPFSIAGGDPLMFTAARVGPFSEALHDLIPGDQIWVRGPFGKSFTLRAGRALLVGGGYGAAPLFFLAGEMLSRQAERRKTARRESVRAQRGARFHTPRDAVPIVALGARTAEDLLFKDRFEALGLEIHVTTEDGSSGTAGLVTDIARSLLDAGRVDGVYACGPEGMLDALASLSRAAGVPAELSYEAYMRCGLGLCGACERDGKLVCMDGPVFRIRA